jgi:hypothetical protein
MNQEDLQHLAMVLLEQTINLGRAMRENMRLNAELAKLQPQPEAPAPTPAPEPVKES